MFPDIQRSISFALLWPISASYAPEGYCKQQIWFSSKNTENVHLITALCLGSKRGQSSITGKKHRKGEQEWEDGKMLCYALLLSRAPSSSVAASFAGMFIPMRDQNASKGWRARKAVPEGPPMKVNDFLQSVQGNETQCYSLPADKAPSGTPLNKKQISRREKNVASKTGTWLRGGHSLPAAEGYTQVCNHPCRWCICISGKMPLPEDPTGTFPNP